MQELAAGVYKIAKDQKRLRTQEELVAEVREQMEAMGTIATLYVELYESSEERLVGGVIFEDERHYRFVYEDGLLHYEEENYDYTEFYRRNCFICRARGQEVFVFSADWCGDCRYLKPFLPEIETENPEFTFILIDRDAYMDLAKVWDVYGIPSLVVLEKDKEIGRVCQSGSENQSADYSILSRIKIGEEHDCNIQQRTSWRCIDADLENSGEAKLRGGEKRKGSSRFTREDNQETVPSE